MLQCGGPTKEGLVLFFKTSKNHDKESVNIAYYCTFTYWAVFLLILSILEGTNNDVSIHSFFLLWTGLLIFFVSESIAKYIRKKGYNLKVYVLSMYANFSNLKDNDSYNVLIS